jgi:hypothetical protein
MTKGAALKIFFDRILVGETKSYNDYGYYVCSGSLRDCYRSYIEGSTRYNKKFTLLPNPLETYTIAYIMDCQSKSKTSSTGQLYGVGRYAIIPSTLKGLIAETKISTSLKFTPAVQDQLGLALLTPSYRKNLRKYILGEVADQTDNLEKAALDTSMIWSSLGIPYDYGFRKKNQSYYVDRGERATVPTSTVQAALKELRKNLNGATETGATSGGGNLFFLALLAGGYYYYRKLRKKQS